MTAENQRSFPTGDNIISDDDVRTLADLAHLYPLPSGFVYERDAHGAPRVVRLADQQTFTFLVEEGILTFDEKIERAGNRPIFRTTEVPKRSSR